MEEEFYNSIKIGDVATTRRLADKFKHWRDYRSTDIGKGVFSGFAGVHYACYFRNKAALDVLLKAQYKSPTLGHTKLPCEYVSKSAKFVNMPSGSDCLYICIISDFLEGAKTILRFYESKNVIYDRINDFGQTALHIAAICRNETGKYIIEEPQLAELWLQQDKSEEATTFLALAAQAGRSDIFSLIDQRFSSLNSRMKEVCATALLFSNEYGEDLEQFAYCEVNCEKLGTSREEKVRTAIMSQRLMKMAHKWLSRCNSIQAMKTLEEWEEKQHLCGEPRKLSRIMREMSCGESTEDFLCVVDHRESMRYQDTDAYNVGYI